MTAPADILTVWFAEGAHTFREAWFREDPAFDAVLRDRFGALADEAAAGRHGDLATTPHGALALCLLLDQVPRNIHRGNARAFAADPLARAVARRAVLRDWHDLALTPVERIFLYLPFEHSEDMADQDLSVALFEGLRDDPRQSAPHGGIAFAWIHRAIIRRFGRFPHRNPVLGRHDTAAEASFRTTEGRGF